MSLFPKKKWSIPLRLGDGGQTEKEKNL